MVGAGGDWEWDGGSVGAVGCEGGADHFDGHRGFVDVAEWLSVVVDRFDEVSGGGEMVADFVPQVLMGFWEADAGGADRDPGAWFFGRGEGVAGDEMGEGILVAVEIDDPFAADELQSERGIAGPVVGDRVEVGDEGIRAFGRVWFEFVSGMHFVSGEWAETFVAVTDVVGGDGLAVLAEDGRAGLGGSAEEVHQVEHVGAEHPQVFGPAAAVSFSPAADFEWAADESFVDETADHGEGRVIAIPVGDGEFGTGGIACGDDLVRFGGGSAKRLFDVDRFGAGADRGDRHVTVLVGVSGTNRDDFGAGFVQHFLVVGVPVVDSEAFLGGLQSGGIGVGDRDDFGVVEFQPDRVESVTVMTATGVSDHGDASP